MRVRGYPRLSLYGYEEALGEEGPAPLPVPAPIPDLSALERQLSEQAAKLASIERIEQERLFWQRISVLITGIGLVLAVPKLFELYAALKERRGRLRAGEA